MNAVLVLVADTRAGVPPENVVARANHLLCVPKLRSTCPASAASERHWQFLADRVSADRQIGYTGSGKARDS